MRLTGKVSGRLQPTLSPTHSPCPCPTMKLKATCTMTVNAASDGPIVAMLRPRSGQAQWIVSDR